MSDSTTPDSPTTEPTTEPAGPAPSADAGTGTATPSTGAEPTPSAPAEGPGVQRVSGDGVTTATGSDEHAGRHSRLVFRVSPIAWLLVLFLLFCVTPVAAGPLRPLLVLYVVPVALGWWIARTRTVAEPTGLDARTVFGRTRIDWDALRGLKIAGRSVVAVLADDRQVKLPEVRLRHLGLLSDISGGRIPDPTAVSPDAESGSATESVEASAGTAGSTPESGSTPKVEAKVESTSARADSGAAEDTPDGGSAAESPE